MTCPKCNGKKEISYQNNNDGIIIDVDCPCPVCDGSGEFDIDKISNVKWGDLDFRDAPDFCDAFVESCDYDGQEANEYILDAINDDSYLIGELLSKKLYA